ncbi:MAG: amidohydrolase [Bacteroidetes bacterium]|nr:amidohydrolase [Bacteroidota bacterium]MCY4206011.1 amidohydrolase [Bacteroidota bacterium]
MSVFDVAPKPFCFPASPANGQFPDEFVDYLINLRRHLHRNPEIGYQEFATSRLIRHHLESQGLEVSGPHAKTGLFVDIEGIHPGPHIGFRCDIDALKMQDAKKTEYASRNREAAHACGHDAHTTIGIGLALNLYRLRHQLKGRVRIFFQPNEEGNPSGSVPMIKAGVCDPLEALYCMHVDPTLDIGQFGVPEGQVTASSERIRVQIRARSTGHSARPHKVKDTIWIATQLLSQYYQYSGRITDARNPSVFTVCMIGGGMAHNVIPSEAWFEGALRCLNDQDRVFLLDYMERTAQNFAATHGVSIKFTRVEGLPAVINNAALGRNVRACIHELFDESATIGICVPSMGAEDFANYLEHVPGMLIRVGTRSSKDTSYPLHDAHFDIDEQALSYSVELMSRVMIRHLDKKVTP